MSGFSGAIEIFFGQRMAQWPTPLTKIVAYALYALHTFSF